MMPVLSVILCTYNRGDSLLNVLEGLQRQELDAGFGQWEVVLVDNNSTDGTRDLIEAHRRRFKYALNYVFEPRQGKSFALNTGIAQSRADFLVFTDDDVVLDPRWLQALTHAGRTLPHGVFGGKVLPLLEGPLPSWLAATGRASVIGGPLVRHDRGDRPRPYDRTMYVPVGCNMAVRRPLFDRHGLFRKDLGHYATNDLIYGEDSELMFRFKKGGETLFYVPDALVHHPAPAHRLQKSYFRRYYWGSGRGAARRSEPAPGTVRYRNIPRHLVRSTLRRGVDLLLALSGRDPARTFQQELLLVYHLGMMLEFYMNAE